MPERDARTEAIFQDVLRVAATGSLPDIGLAFWDRGGPPGPGYSSHLWLLRGNDGLREGYEHKTHDATLDPPWRIDRFSARTDPEQVKRIAALFAQAFDADHDEEKVLPVGGVTKITLRAFTPKGEIEKTYYAKMPEALSELETLIRERIGALAEG